MLDFTTLTLADLHQAERQRQADRDRQAAVAAAARPRHAWAWLTRGRRRGGQDASRRVRQYASTPVGGVRE